MDRFIVLFLLCNVLKDVNLKSNMDRFIAVSDKGACDRGCNLKSNMDRFIENPCLS